MRNSNENAHSPWKYFSVFDTGLSVAEKIGRILVFLFITASGTVTAFVAKLDPLLQQLGPIYWIGIGVVISLVLTLIYYLLKLSFYRQAQTQYYRTLAIPKSHVNPLDESFRDVVIYMEDLRLPSAQIHKGKHFKRCKFVGPSSMALIAGSVISCIFTNCEEIIALPNNTRVTGLLVFQDCSIEACEFINMTILADQITAHAFHESGIPVNGLVDRGA